MAINPENINTISVGELPPASFNLTDKIPHEIGTDLFHGTIQDLVNFIAPMVGAIQFQVITLHVNQAYIDANFEANGLGKNLMLGYAICNGNNNTKNKDGKVGIAYGATTNVIGQSIGAKTAFVSSQITGFGVGTGSAGDTSGLPAGKLIVSSGQTEVDEVLESVKKVSAPPPSQEISIMQPSLVELHVMKL